jgi:tetratricopeptide (TPR) repeat protein
MEEPDIQKRVSDLEQKVDTLRKSLKADAAPVGLIARSQSIARFLGANWALLSFVAALLVAGYVKYRFGIDYFESYRNVATNRELSNFYEQMGDRMMAKSEWQAAEQAYRNALQINANNTEATFGIVKAQVFQPVPGEKYWAPEVVDARLDYLLSRFPDDYQIYFLKAIRYRSTGDNAEAASWLQKCIDKKPAFTGCYIELGYIDIGQSKVNEAKANFEKAVELDPNSAMAKNDLAACHFLLSDFSGAARGFQESYKISPTALTALNIGEAYWFSGDFASALEIHQIAADYMNGTHDPQDRYIGSDWREPFFPLHVGDLETIKITTQVFNAEQKKAILHIALAVDHALLEQFDDANREFAIALNPQPPLGHRQLIQNRMQSAENMVQMSDASRSWLAEHRKMLH